MSTNADQISIVLSGGSGNTDQNASLGGDPSSTPVTSGNLNNLFDNISPEQSQDGHEDYRCIYFFNDGNTTVYLIKVLILNDFAEGSTLKIGIESRDESQRITLTGPCTGGTLELTYKNKPFTINYNADLASWANELEAKILDLTNDDDENFFQDVTVTAQTAGANVIIFDILFSNQDGKQNYDLFEISDNLLQPLNDIGVAVTKTLEGAPINSIAPEISLETTPPGGVGFYAASSQSPIELPKLAPTEGFPIWIKRTTAAGVTAQDRDGFEMRFSAQSQKPTI